MEAVSIKFEDTFLQNVEKAMSEHNYATKAEFIREAIRDKLNELEKQKYMMKAMRLYGSGKKKHGHITDEDLDKARERAAHEMAQELGVDLK
jgi:metal-responsive CopG/Arc/MetJ family transcriptional regulator